MKEIDTEPGLHICKAIDLLLEHAQNEDCFTTFNGICLAADRSTSKGALLDKYDEAMAEASRKYKQTQETEQRERYQRPMREQIERLIAKIHTERQECVDIMDGHPELTYANHEYLLGKRVSLDWASDHLQAILDSEN